MRSAAIKRRSPAAGRSRSKEAQCRRNRPSCMSDAWPACPAAAELPCCCCCPFCCCYLLPLLLLRAAAPLIRVTPNRPRLPVCSVCCCCYCGCCCCCCCCCCRLPCNCCRSPKRLRTSSTLPLPSLSSPSLTAAQLVQSQDRPAARPLACTPPPACRSSRQSSRSWPGPCSATQWRPGTWPARRPTHTPVLHMARVVRFGLLGTGGWAQQKAEEAGKATPHRRCSACIPPCGRLLQAAGWWSCRCMPHHATATAAKARCTTPHLLPADGVNYNGHTQAAQLLGRGRPRQLGACGAPCVRLRLAKQRKGGGKGSGRRAAGNAPAARRRVLMAWFNAQPYYPVAAGACS